MPRDMESPLCSEDGDIEFDYLEGEEVEDEEAVEARVLKSPLSFDVRSGSVAGESEARVDETRLEDSEDDVLDLSFWDLDLAAKGREAQVPMSFSQQQQQQQQQQRQQHQNQQQPGMQWRQPQLQHPPVLGATPQAQFHASSSLPCPSPWMQPTSIPQLQTQQQLPFACGCVGPAQAGVLPPPFADGNRMLQQPQQQQQQFANLSLTPQNPFCGCAPPQPTFNPVPQQQPGPAPPMMMMGGGGGGGGGGLMGGAGTGGENPLNMP